MEWPLTFKCNNRCISCILDLRQIEFMGSPFPEQVRDVIDKVPEGDYLSFTGGEPTLREELFEFIEYARKKYPEKFIFVVTNARRFSDKKFTERLAALNPGNFKIGSAIYSHESKVHDAIACAEGSWSETIAGIKNLLEKKIKVELRIIVQKANYKDMEKTAEFIAENLAGVERVVFINMKYTGNAFINRKKTFVRCSEAAPFIEKAADILLEKGIEVKMFHFPLCIIGEKYWPLAEGTTKQAMELTLLEKCGQCKVKGRCPKIWKSYLPLAGKEEFRPITSIENKKGRNG